VVGLREALEEVLLMQLALMLEIVLNLLPLGVVLRCQNALRN
jgi:hypothetical protein